MHKIKFCPLWGNFGVLKSQISKENIIFYIKLKFQSNWYHCTLYQSDINEVLNHQSCWKLLIGSLHLNVGHTKALVTNRKTKHLPFDLGVHTHPPCGYWFMSSINDYSTADMGHRFPQKKIPHRSFSTRTYQQKWWQTKWGNRSIHTVEIWLTMNYSCSWERNETEKRKCKEK